MKRKTRKLTSLLLALVMALTLLPVTAFGALVTYPLIVQGVQANALNRDDVLGDGGSVKFTPAAGNSDRPKLTLTNANITAATIPGDVTVYGIHSELPMLELELKGASTITGSTAPYGSVGIYSYSRLPATITVTGSGSLTIDMTPSSLGENNYAPIEAGYLEMEGGRIVAKSGEGIDSTAVRINTLIMRGGSLTAIAAPGAESFGLTGGCVFSSGTLELSGQTAATTDEIDFANANPAPVITVNTDSAANGAIPWDREYPLGPDGDWNFRYKYVKLSNSSVGPVITSQPDYCAVAVGATASFSVAAQGSGLTYQWQYRKNPNDAWKNSGASSARTARLSFTATAAQNGYEYQCIVTDPTGASATSQIAGLIVTSPLTITTQPRSATVAAGATATFTVVATGGAASAAAGLSYQWQYLAPGGTWKNSGASSARTATLSFTATAAQNGYKYRCIVTDPAGVSVTSNAVTLTVSSSAGVTITTQPKSTTVAAGAKAAFTVKASGTGLTYQWQYLAPGGAWKNSGASSARTATLSFNATAAQNGYKYRCVVKNAAGASVTSSAATLTVSAGVTITTQPKSVTVAEGSKATFSITAAGSGLTYQWQYLAPGGSWKNSGASAARTATLSFNATAAQNGYKYRCVVTDSSGKSVTSNAATLTVGSGSAAPSITTQPKNAKVTAGGRAAFTVAATGTGLTYQWQYLAPGSTWKNSGASSARTATLSFTAAATHNGYKYRCIVTGGGQSVESSPATLTVS